jgi:outer membrane protein assembly factor BamB
VVCLAKADGEPVWKIRHLDSTPTKPTLVGNYLMYGSTDFGMYVVDRTSGYPLLRFDPKGGFNAPITWAGGMALMFSNRGYLYGFHVARL